ncbi:MAG: hypothetical protein ACLT98_14480 [Eggerthellaceae bacterium]
MTDLFEPGSIFVGVAMASWKLAPDARHRAVLPVLHRGRRLRIGDAHERGDATYTLRQIMDQSSNVGISLATENATVGDGVPEPLQQDQRVQPAHEDGVDYPGEGEPAPSTWGTCFPSTIGARSPPTTSASGRACRSRRCRSPASLSVVNDGVECTPHSSRRSPKAQTAEYGSDTVIMIKKAIDDWTSMLKTVVTGTGRRHRRLQRGGQDATAEIYDEKNGGYRKGGVQPGLHRFRVDSSSQLFVLWVQRVPTDGVVTPIFKDIMTTAIDRFNIYPE